MRPFFKIVLTISIWAWANNAAGCATGTGGEQDFGVFKEAEIIVRAKIVNVEISPFKLRDNRIVESANVTFETIEEVFPWKPGRKHWIAHWDTAMFIPPRPERLSTNVIVGFKSFIRSDGQPALEVVQQPCGPASVLPDTRQNLVNVLKAIGLRPGPREKVLNNQF